MTDLHEWISQQADLAEAENTIPLRRLEADRRILARHRLDRTARDDWTRATACEGCGTYGEYDDPATDNLNDCPELLDLAHAYGLTEQQLAELDRPQTPPRPPVQPYPKTLAEAWQHLLASTPATEAPATFRPATARTIARWTPVSEAVLNQHLNPWQ